MNNRLFAIGDIHGCSDSFKRLMEETIRIKHGDKVILLGDYVDRVTQSKEVVDYIIELQDKGFDVISLLGNHEAMLLDAYKNNDAVPLWIQNGGAETLKSFGINSPTNLQSKYIDFFKSLNLFYSIEEYLFVHAGFNDSIENPFEDTYHMIWKCRDHYTHPILRNRTIIHGHCPVKYDLLKEVVHSNKNVINIDTGCVYNDRVGYGKLSTFEVHSRSINFV